ncbi:MAG TPA: hypothetical protein PLR88_11360 [Bacteroidales bacterium]|nr:hypothetical protein [Bacteroidales bacterium]
MKKTLILFLAIVFAITACKSKRVGYTLLGDGTPYYPYPERLIGKVQTVIEKNYWAIPDGNSYKKGKPLTQADRDSIGGWTLDFEANFDNSGDLLSCNYLDENGKIINKYEISSEGKHSVIGKKTAKDTVSFYDKYKLDKNGKRVGFIRYEPLTDTMVGTFDIKDSWRGDTMEYNLVNSKGESRYKIIILFNGLEQFVRSEGYGKDGLFRFANEVTYNDKGKISELKIYDKDKNVTGINYFTYEYDQKGNWTKAIVKDGINKDITVIEERVYTYFENYTPGTWYMP